MDKIYLKNIEIFANHGVFKEEKTLGQKFILSLELSLDLKESANSQDLQKSVHYGELCHKVEEVFTEKSFDLIETIADKIAKFILEEYKNVLEVKVNLKKPWAPIGRHLDYACVEISRRRHKCFISIGSNIGDKLININNSISEIKSLESVYLKKVSTIIESEPWGYLEQDAFLNAVIEVETILTPKELMINLLAIEEKLGRVREKKWGPRIIDLDILLVDDIISNDEFIILPHPQMHLRDFVLNPLNEIAPNAIHPLKKKRIFELVNN